MPSHMQIAYQSINFIRILNEMSFVGFETVMGGFCLSFMSSQYSLFSFHIRLVVETELKIVESL